MLLAPPRFPRSQPFAAMLSADENDRDALRAIEVRNGLYDSAQPAEAGGREGRPYEYAEHV